MLSPIQRIIIIHLNLHELCVADESSLGENASLEERSEQILLYYQSSRVVKDGEIPTEEAVTFAGLCAALYSLPTSIDPSLRCDDRNYELNNDGIEDKTKSIYFDNSLLVFVPLESKLNIIAVVQISRLYQDGIEANTGSASPIAITASIERSHQLFCLLHGGGIVRRLKQNSRAIERNNAVDAKSENEEYESIYPGMGRLFGLMKHIRKSKEQIMKLLDSSSDQKIAEIKNRINDLENEVMRLRREFLPIESIRRDLNAHYNEYISDFLEVSIRNGRAGRCQVDLMPIPVAADCWTHAIQSSPSHSQPKFLEKTRIIIREMLHNCFSRPLKDRCLHKPLGITVFHKGVHLLDCNFGKILISRVSLGLLMSYMASYRTKMRYAAMSIANQRPLSSLSCPERHPGILKRLAHSIRPIMVDETIHNSKFHGEFEHTTSNWTDTRRKRGRFIPSPPTFMMGATDQIFSLSYGDAQEKNVWTPRISIHIESKNEENTDDFLDMHMAVFEFRQFSFLIFINSSLITNASSLENKSAITSLMMELEEKLSETVLHTFHDDISGVETELGRTEASPRISEDLELGESAEPGQDIIYFEKSKQKMILLMDPKIPFLRSDNKKRSLVNDTEGRVSRFWNKAKDEMVSQSSHVNLESAALEWSARGLDCRHILASRLPLDICLAFDDMMHEVSIRKDAWQRILALPDSNESKLSSFKVEICTCMACGWVYTFATVEKDIYAFFNNTIYVTFADVQSAALRVKERFSVT